MQRGAGGLADPAEDGLPAQPLVRLRRGVGFEGRREARQRLRQRGWGERAGVEPWGLSSSPLPTLAVPRSGGSPKSRRAGPPPPARLSAPAAPPLLSTSSAPPPCSGLQGEGGAGRVREVPAATAEGGRRRGDAPSATGHFSGTPGCSLTVASGACEGPANSGYGHRSHPAVGGPVPAWPQLPAVGCRLVLHAGGLRLCSHCSSDRVSPAGLWSNQNNNNYPRHMSGDPRGGHPSRGASHASP